MICELPLHNVRRLFFCKNYLLHNFAICCKLSYTFPAKCSFYYIQTSYWILFSPVTCGIIRSRKRKQKTSQEEYDIKERRNLS